MEKELNKSVNYWLKDFGSDFEEVNEEIKEEVLEIDDKVEEEKTIVENLFDIFERFDSLSINENDSDMLVKLNISEELYTIQETLDSIKEKLLDESVADIVASSPVLLPIIAGGITAAIGWITKRKAGGDSAIPRPVVNTLYAINQYVTKGEEKERRNVIEKTVRKAYPNLSKKEIDDVINISLKNVDKLKMMKSSSPKRVLHGGAKSDYVTDFAKINRERFGLDK